MIDVCSSVYKTIVTRAEEKKATRHVRLPPALWEHLADDEIKWLTEVCGVTMSEDASITEPIFSVTVAS